MRRSPIRRALMVLALAALAPSAASASFNATVTEVTTKSTANLYTYTYTLTVLASSTVAATQLDLTLGAPIDPNSIVAPPDFLAFYNPGDPDIQFVNFLGGVGGAGFADSRTFSFTSAFAPGAMSFAIGSADPSTGVIFGPTTGPTSVPEPSSVLMCGLGLVALAGLARRRPAAA